MENRNIAFFFQFLFDLETSGSCDVFQVNAAEAAGDHIDGIYDFIHIFALNAQRECVHIAKSFEQHAFSFHNRHTCFRSDIAQTQYGRSVRYNQTHIVASCVFIALVHILLNFKTRLCNTRCISQRQILFGCNRHSRYHFDFALPLSMKSQGLFCIIHSFYAP